MSLGFWELLLIFMVAFLVFGGKLPKMMGDLGKGIKNLKQELKADNNSSPQNLQDKTENIKKVEDVNSENINKNS